MKIFLFFVVVVSMACSSSKKNKNVDQPVDTGNSSDTIIPACIQEKIKQFSAEEKQNPPRSIYSYVYEGRTLYYVNAPCCDFFSDLYDSACVLVAHPDGGFTGRGDGTMPDFATKRTNEKFIWQDSRK